MDDKIFLQPYNYIIQCGGKQIRSKLIKAFNVWLKVPEKLCKVVGEIVEMLHNASLLIDDIEDNSVLRRGIPVAHNIFGIATTINCANYAYFLSLEKLIKELPQEKVSEAVQIFTEQLLELHRGQGMDIHWRETLQCPTEEEYKSMIRKKTGGLFGLGVKLMQLFSEDKRDFSLLISHLGTFFQIRDDYVNLTSKEYAENKSFCEDLTEGKFSFPIVHGIKSRPDDPTLINIVKQRTTNVEIKKFAVDWMEKLGSFEYTRKVLVELYEDAKAECERLGGNKYINELLNLLAKDINAL